MEQRGFLTFPGGSALGNVEMSAEAGQALALAGSLGSRDTSPPATVPPLSLPPPGLSGFLASSCPSWSPSQCTLPF